ncbi:hypothetical protein BHM03_00040721 [Ensete ventricosum]|nr:hypothetical protein BHM03_00040721 [Ensete ventricosum]
MHSVCRSYLISLLPLLLTISSYLSTMHVVLAVRRAPTIARELIEAGADPTEQELGNYADRAVAREQNEAGADPTEQELEIAQELNEAGADPTDPTEQELGDYADRAVAWELNEAGADPTKQELGS